MSYAYDMFKRLFSQQSAYTFCCAGILAALAAIQPCAADDGRGSTAVGRKLSLKELRLDVSETDLAKSNDFAYFPGGHFGDKTQYMGGVLDEFGGAYAVHCRQGKPFSIEAKYQGNGIERDAALKIMQRLLPPNAGSVIEHDDEDLRKMDAPQAAEFFYYATGPRTELLYAHNSNKKVVQINIWTKNG